VRVPARSAAGRRGFTLVEILVALAIFAIMAAIAFRGINSALDTRKNIVDDSRKWREVALAFAMIERDLSAAANRPARSPDDLVLPAFTGNAPEVSRANAALDFSRTGDAGTPSRRVAYRLNGSTLELLAYPSIDAAPRDEPAIFSLLPGVETMSARFLDSAGIWQVRWPALNASNLGPKKEPPLPRAVALTVRLASGEELNRVFALP
jgi:general secretion pathway protein J